MEQKFSINKNQTFPICDVTGDSEEAAIMMQDIIDFQRAAGGVISPFDSWLCLRGMRSLAVRMERHCKNAEAVARYLSTHTAVAKVYYPGLVIFSQFYVRVCFCFNLLTLCFLPLICFSFL